MRKNSGGIRHPPRAVSHRAARAVSIYLEFGRGAARALPHSRHRWLNCETSRGGYRIPRDFFRFTLAIHPRDRHGRAPRHRGNMTSRWISTDGGPLLSLPSAKLGAWNGSYLPGRDGDFVIETFRGPFAFTTNYDFANPRTDYERACSIDGLVGPLEVDGALALVLDDHPLDTTWLPTSGGGLFARPFTVEPWANVEAELATLGSACGSRGGSATSQPSNSRGIGNGSRPRGARGCGSGREPALLAVRAASRADVDAVAGDGGGLRGACDPDHRRRLRALYEGLGRHPDRGQLRAVAARLATCSSPRTWCIPSTRRHPRSPERVARSAPRGPPWRIRMAARSRRPGRGPRSASADRSCQPS